MAALARGRGAHSAAGAPALVALGKLFERVWENALPFARGRPQHRERGDRELTSQEQAVLRLLGEGLTDEVRGAQARGRGADGAARGHARVAVWGAAGVGERVRVRREQRVGGIGGGPRFVVRGGFRWARSLSPGWESFLLGAMSPGSWRPTAGCRRTVGRGSTTGSGSGRGGTSTFPPPPSTCSPQRGRGRGRRRGLGRFRARRPAGLLLATNAGLASTTRTGPPTPTTATTAVSPTRSSPICVPPTARRPLVSTGSATTS